MARPSKLAAVLAIAVVLCALASTPAAARGYAGGDEGAAQPPEDCPTQLNYFKNCLAYGELERPKCCTVVADRKCLCQLERELAVPCHNHRRHKGKSCAGNNRAPAPPVKKSELQGLPCFQNLKC